MVVETLLPVAAVGGTAGLAYAAKRKIFPGAPTPDKENFVLPIKLKSADAEDINSRFIKGVRIPRRTLLTLGASGSGKNETLKHFADDLRADPNSQIVVFDMKRDYQEFFESRETDMIRLSSEGSTDEDGSAIAWNLFWEIETEEDADELARALFPEDQGDFWTGAARHLFAANLKYLRRELEDPDNADLVRYWQRATPEKMHENLTRDGHEDLTAAASAINPDTNAKPARCSRRPSSRLRTCSSGTSRRAATSPSASTWRTPTGGSWCSITRRDSLGRSRSCSGS